MSESVMLSESELVGVIDVFLVGVAVVRHGTLDILGDPLGPNPVIPLLRSSGCFYGPGFDLLCW